MTYGYQTWSLNKQMTNKLRTTQRAMERKMLDLKLQDKIPCSEIRKRTKINDSIEYTLKQKWKWAGHIARMKDNRWTKRCTEWQPRRGKRSRGRPSRRWQDDITEKEGTAWIRKQQTDDNGRHWWMAISCSGWTKPRRRWRRYWYCSSFLYIVTKSCPVEYRLSSWPGVGRNRKTPVFTKSTIVLQRGSEEDPELHSHEFTRACC